MEIGPTCHYVMGGVEVDPDTQESARHRACTPWASAPAACTAPTGSAATRSATCWCSASAPASTRRETSPRWARTGPRSSEDDVTAAAASALAPFEVEGGENPYTIQQDLQQSMNDLVGIIRDGAELEQALDGDRGVQGAGQEHGRRGPPAVQPGLAPLDRPAQHADRLGVRSRRRRWPARSPAAATPATTSRRPTTTSGARRTSSSPSTTSGDGVDADREAAAGDAGRAQEVLRGELTDGLQPEDAALARRPGRRRPPGLRRSRSPRARSSSTRSTASRPRRPATSRSAGTARPASAAPARAEINGKPQAACACAGSRTSTSPRRSRSPRCGRSRSIRDLVTDVSLQLREGAPSCRRSPRRRATRTASAGWPRSTSSGARSSASASSASCARTSATSSVTTRTTSRRSPARGSSCGTPSSTCTPSTPTTAASSPRAPPASACATSPSAAPRCAPRASRSPTTRSSR